MNNMIQSDINLVLLNKQQTNKQEVYKFVCSDSSLNRNGWEILTQGIKLDNYKNNPVLLFNHDKEKSIGKCINIYIENDKLIGDFVFHELNELSSSCKKMVDTGNLNSVSIGCMPLKRGTPKPISPENKDRFGGWRNATDVFLETELTEISLVSVPANTSAQFIEKLNNSLKTGEISAQDYAVAIGKNFKYTDLTGDAQNILSNGLNNQSIQELLNEIDDVLDNELLSEQAKSAQIWSLHTFLKNSQHSSDLRIQRVIQIVESCIKQ